MDRASFKHWMVALGERHNRVPTPAVVALYGAALAQMDAADFEAACASLFLSGTHFPSPQEILDASPARQRRVALTQRLFDELYARVTGYWEPGTTAEQKSHRIDEQFGTPALAAFKVTGGFERWLTVFRGQDERQVEWLRKEFLQEYRASQQVAAGRELAAAPSVRRLVAQQAKAIEAGEPAKMIGAGDPVQP